MYEPRSALQPAGSSGKLEVDAPKTEPTIGPLPPPPSEPAIGPLPPPPPPPPPEGGAGGVGGGLEGGEWEVYDWEAVIFNAGVRREADVYTTTLPLPPEGELMIPFLWGFLVSACFVFGDFSVCCSHVRGGGMF